jgi:hypothetical protein
MSARIETDGDRTYTFESLPPPPDADRVRAVVRARAFDEVTGEPIESTMHVTSPRSDLLPRASRDGLFGLVGQPARDLPALATVPIDLSLQLLCPGYLPVNLSGTLGPVVGFPNVFAPLDFGDVGMHRRGVMLEGRVVRRQTVAPPPIAGATVVIDAVWSVLPPPNWTPPALAEAPNVVAIDPGLYSDRALGAQVSQRALTLAPTSQTLVEPVSVGQAAVRLSDRKGLVAGGWLMLDRDTAALTEIVQITAVEPTLADDEISWVTLAYPCRRLHRTLTVCQGVTPQVPVAPTTTARDARSADGVLFLTAAPGMADGSWIEITTGVGPGEFHRASLYQTVTDAQGYFRLPPIARIALARLLVQHAGFTDQQPIFTLDYRTAVQAVTVAMH